MKIDVTTKASGKIFSPGANEIAVRTSLKHLATLVESIKTAVVAGAPKATGKLASSIDTVVDERSAWVFYRWPKGMPYGIPIEKGTKPFYPPTKELVKWVELKLGHTGAEARRAAFAIANKRGKETAQRPSNSWFYSHCERAVASFESQYLVPIGVDIAKELQE